MSRNKQNQQPDRKFLALITRLRSEVENLKRTQRLVVPHFATNPDSPINGELWYNEAEGKIKKRENDTTKDLEDA